MVGWLFGRLIRWLVGWLGGCVLAWLILLVCLCDWLDGLVGWLLVGCLVVWLVGWIGA